MPRGKEFGGSGCRANYEEQVNVARRIVGVFVRVISRDTGNVGTREAIYNVPRY